MRLHRCGFPPAIAQHHNGLVASVVQVQEQVPAAWVSKVQEQVPAAWVSKKGYVVERSAQPRAHAYPGATWRQNSCLLSSSNMQQEQEQQEQRQQQQVVELWLLLSSLLLELWRRGVAGVAEGSQGCRRCVTGSQGCKGVAGRRGVAGVYRGVAGVSQGWQRGRRCVAGVLQRSQGCRDVLAGVWSQGCHSGV